MLRPPCRSLAGEGAKYSGTYARLKKVSIAQRSLAGSLMVSGRLTHSRPARDSRLSVSLTHGLSAPSLRQLVVTPSFELRFISKLNCREVRCFLPPLPAFPAAHHARGLLTLPSG